MCTSEVYGTIRYNISVCKLQFYYSIIFAYLYRQGLPKKSPNEFVASPVCSENEV